jgi:tetratricopeptide (TPR) repeat protein
MQFFLSISVLAVSVLAGCASPGSTGGATLDGAPGMCYRDSCCGQASALAFTPHRLRCEALAAEKTGLLREAEKGFSEVLRQTRTLPEENRRGAQEVFCLALIDAARVSDTLGDLGRAISYYAEGVRECANTYGAASGEVARARIGLANMQIDTGRLVEASAGLQLLLEISRQHQNRGVRAAALDAMGRLEDRREEHSKARALFKQALDIQNQEFGERSIEAGYTMMHLGDNAMMLRGWVDARGWYMRALDVFELGIGKRNRYYVNTKTALAAAFLRDRRYDALPPLYEDLLILSREVFGARSEEYAGTLNDAAAYQYMQKQYPAAFEKFKLAAEIRRQAMPGSMLLGWTDLNAAKTRLEFNHCGLARPMLIEAQDILTQQRQSSSPDPELAEYSAEFARVAKLCAARPEPISAPPAKPRLRTKKK